MLNLIALIALIAIEVIKNLKARYFLALDTKDWELLGDCLTDNVAGRYSGGELSFDGKENLIGFMVDNLSATHIVRPLHKSNSTVKYRKWDFSPAITATILRS